MITQYQKAKTWFRSIAPTWEQADLFKRTAESLDKAEKEIANTKANNAKKKEEYMNRFINYARSLYKIYGKTKDL